MEKTEKKRELTISATDRQILNEKLTTKERIEVASKAGVSIFTIQRYFKEEDQDRLAVDTTIKVTNAIMKFIKNRNKKLKDLSTAINKL